MKHSSGDIWTTCEVCTKRIRVRDAIYVTDRYSKQFGRVVCREDHDRHQPLSKPLTNYRGERPITPSVLKKLRPQAVGRDREIEVSDRAPGKPTQLKATASTNGVRLSWLAPDNQGSSQITGYVITRAEPQLAIQVIIVADTDTEIPYYLDEDAVLSSEYTYSVAAINDFGTGAYSELAFYPARNVPAAIDTGLEQYLCSSDDGYSILNGDGEYITVLVE